MTIITTQSRITYSGDGVSTNFPIPFEFFVNTDITAVKTSVGGAVTTLVQTVDYVLTGAGIPAGGTALKTTPLLTGETMALFLNPPIEQESHYPANNPFPASTLENDLDRQTQISQRLADLLSLSLRAPDGDPPAGTSGFLLPSAVARANTFLTFDASGNPATSLTLPPGTTLSLASITALTGAQTPAEAAALVTPVNKQYAQGVVDRYGTNTTPGTTSMVAAFNAAIKVARISGGTVRYGATGRYLLDSPVNCTFGTSADQNGILIQGPAFSLDHPIFPIIAKHTGNAVFDCTGSDAITFSDCAITTDAAVYPQTGILFARAVLSGGGNNSQVNRLSRVAIDGSFSVANYYNYGSEDDVLHACFFVNRATTANTKTRVYTANNISGIASSFVTIATGTQSCIDHNAFGCQDFNAGGTSTSDCVYIEQSDSYKSYGGWAVSAGASSNGRALVYVDMTHGASNLGVISGLTAENAANNQANFLAFSNHAQTPTGWEIDACTVNCATQPFNIGALVTLDNFHIRNLNVSIGPHTIIIPGTLQNSVYECPAMNLTVGVSSKNRLTGDTAGFTITTRNFDYWIDIGSTNKTIATLGTSGGITSSAGALIARARLSLSGPCLHFNIALASTSGNLAIAANSTVTITAPGGQLMVAADSAACVAVDQTSGTAIGAVVSSSGGNVVITLPVAVVATPHSIIISGTVFLA